ncbi:MAG: AAA family ATPase [Anaerolineae bacterium]
MTPPEPLSADQLCMQCNPDIFPFDTTSDLDDDYEVIGQERAVQAVRFSVGMPHRGYNVFVMGSSGIGRRNLVERFFNEAAAERAVPQDLCYVNNFDASHQPHLIELPPGKGSELRADMEELVEQLQAALSGVFESEEYQARRQEIEQEVNEEQEDALETIRDKANEQGMAMVRTPGGLVFAPVKEGQVMSPEEFQTLEQDEKERLQEIINGLQKDLQQVVQQRPRLQRELQERVKDLNKEMANIAISGLFDEMREQYADFEDVLDFLNAVEKDVLDNLRRIMPGNDNNQQGGSLPGFLRRASAQQEEALFQRYEVNVIVDHSESEHAPVVYENNPTYNNLLGRVEFAARMGALTTNFTMIKAGAMHRANGGYLILDARALLMQPYAYEGLKRALRSGELRIESPGQMAGVISTQSLEPEPTPLNLKIALIGERILYYQLKALDPDFGELFKEVADFEETLERSEENQVAFAHTLANLIREHDLRPFDRTAVARVIERGARLVSDAERVTINMLAIGDLMREANYYAEEAGSAVVSGEHVQQAIEAQIFRVDRARERTQEAIERDLVLIDTEGEVIGQVNGLSVLQLGDFAFGRPSRITASIRLGSGEVVDIEREVELSGPLHAKGVLILSGFLGERYATDHPLSLSASLVFEQSYGGVDGDSASSAELYALLSAIAQAPIKQAFAVTGSVNQNGQVQAIGGVNEKIEGFFDICRTRGVTGEQGVLIPVSNVQNLMLRQDVIDAVEAGDFHIYPVRTIDEGIELLTGVPAGEKDEDGNYPADTINGRVKARLAEMARQRAAFSRELKDE